MSFLSFMMVMISVSLSHAEFSLGNARLYIHENILVQPTKVQSIRGILHCLKHPLQRVRSALNALQQHADEPILLGTLARKLVARTNILAEFGVRLEVDDLDLGVAAMVDEVKQVDEDLLQFLELVSDRDLKRFAKS